MTNRSSHYTGAGLNLQQNQQRQKKGSKFKHRAALHVLIGVACFGLFMGSFSRFEQEIATQFNIFNPVPAARVLYQIPQTANLQQKHGASDYAISLNILDKPSDTIHINRNNKRNSTYYVEPPKFSKQQLVQMAEHRAKQIAELDRQAAIRAAKQRVADKREAEQRQAAKAQLAKLAAQQELAAKLAKNNASSAIKPKNIANFEALKIAEKPPLKLSAKKQDLTVQPDAKQLLTKNISTPKILTTEEIDRLKRDISGNAELYLAEQIAPMPTIHTADGKSDFVEAMLAKVTAQAHDTQIGWSAGNGKSSAIRRQTIALNKLNGFTLVDGKITTKVNQIVGDRILMANVKVPAPLKRPKYTPRAKTNPLTTNRTSLTCLTTALYHEVRGESRAGQLAVAEVISSRRRSKSYPNTFCGVIYQNATKRNACQFSFACDGKTDLPRDLKTWKKMKTLASDFLAGRAGAPAVRGATHYHTKAVSPKWRWAMTRLGSIGAHIFYKDPKARA